MIRLLKIPLQIAGIFLLLIGLAFIARGYFPHRGSRFMTDPAVWAHRGEALGVLGLVIMIASRWLK